LSFDNLFKFTCEDGQIKTFNSYSFYEGYKHINFVILKTIVRLSSRLCQSRANLVECVREIEERRAKHEGVMTTYGNGEGVMVTYGFARV